MGQWEVVSKGYNISVDDIVLNSLHAGQVYYPKGAITQGPLVLFLHGNGTGGYNNYSEILSQLASQGFSVASIGWPSGDYKALEKVESIKTHIFKHIRYLYNDNLSPLKGKITDNIILVGHSRGGAAAVGFAADIDKIKNVQSVIALAPSPAELDMPEKFSLACTSSFLVIYGSGDADVTGKVCDDGYIKKKWL